MGLERSYTSYIDLYRMGLAHLCHRGGGRIFGLRGCCGVAQVPETGAENGPSNMNCRVVDSGCVQLCLN